LWEMEADVIPIGVSPDGRNINDGFGATATENLQKAVVEHGADVGIALDGDADRLIMVDENGVKIDGDQLMGALTLFLHEKGLLKGGGLVATVMSNLGLERMLESKGLTLVRANVGDRYVSKAMEEGGYNIGGEQSGHIIMSDHGTTGDGLLAALQILSIIKNSGQKASEVLNVFEPLPQLLKSVRFDGGAPMEAQDVKDAIAKAEQTLANDGRLLVRASGTEPVIRVMAEGDDSRAIENIVNGLCAVIEKAAQNA
jgi:phosphoglucosamine mutase